MEHKNQIINFYEEVSKCKKTRQKITQHGKVYFIKINELKLIQAELFQFFHFMCIAANAPELIWIALLANIKHFLYHSNLTL